jgi:hypothetical protein
MAEDDVLRMDAIAGETEALEFLDLIVRQIEDTKALEEGTAARIKELSERKSRFERRQEALRALCFKIMQTGDIKKAELSIATLSIRAGTAKVVIHDEAALPLDCVKTSITPDKTAIKEKLQGGATVAGAYLSNGEPTLSIRVK